MLLQKRKDSSDWMSYDIPDINPLMPGGNKKVTRWKVQVCLSLTFSLPPGIKRLIRPQIYA